MIQKERMAYEPGTWKGIGHNSQYRCEYTSYIWWSALVDGCSSAKSNGHLLRGIHATTISACIEFPRSTPCSDSQHAVPGTQHGPHFIDIMTYGVQVVCSLHLEACWSHPCSQLHCIPLFRTMIREGTMDAHEERSRDIAMMAMLALSCSVICHTSYHSCRNALRNPTGLARSCHEPGQGYRRVGSYPCPLITGLTRSHNRSTHGRV